MQGSNAIGYCTSDRGLIEKMVSDVRHNPTLAQNIDQRIAMLEQQVDRLTRVKVLLAEPAGILNVPIDDLRFAMNY
jgi:hypothetical protein